MSNNAKNAMKHSENSTRETCLEAFKKCFENTVLGSKIRFSAQMSNSAKKKPWNTQKHQQNMFWGYLRNSWKIRFSAQKCGSQHRFRTMLKYLETLRKTPTKYVLRLFKKFLKIRFSAQKSGSQPRYRTMLKILWNTQKTPTKHALRHFKNFLKIWFSAQKSGSRPRCRTMLKILWNTKKTPTKHALRHFKNFF